MPCPNLYKQTSWASLLSFAQITMTSIHPDYQMIVNGSSFLRFELLLACALARFCRKGDNTPISDTFIGEVIQCPRHTYKPLDTLDLIATLRSQYRAEIYEIVKHDRARWAYKAQLACQDWRATQIALRRRSGVPNFCL